MLGCYQSERRLCPFEYGQDKAEVYRIVGLRNTCWYGPETFLLIVDLGFPGVAMQEGG